MTTTLYDLIEHADAIEIDDHFIRYFELDLEGASTRMLVHDAIVLHVEVVDDGYSLWEWNFTVSDLERAVYNAESKGWTVQIDNEEPCIITIYSVKPIAVIG